MYHDNDESECPHMGSFATLKEANIKCFDILLESLRSLYESGANEKKLAERWWHFGENPVIRNLGPEDPIFSAAKEMPLLVKMVINEKDDRGTNITPILEDLLGVSEIEREEDLRMLIEALKSMPEDTEITTENMAELMDIIKAKKKS